MSEHTFFPYIPMMHVSSARDAALVHSGAENYVKDFSGTNKQDYEQYLRDLEEIGYERHSDNGAGIDCSVYTATYVKDNISITVTHVARTGHTYVSVGFDMSLSEHLHPQIKSERDCAVNEKTSLHMFELWYYGNCFIFRLKNGHFVLVDTGQWRDARYLLDYLDSLTPEGEKPIVEAIIISHTHGDHMGLLTAIWDEEELAKRIYVDGIYYSIPNDKVQMMTTEIPPAVGRVEAVRQLLKTSTGEKTKIYRPQTGQRYYFDDITMDVLFTQEQLLRENYDKDFNDSSTICMFTVEGQKLFFSGDTHRGGLGFVKDAYSREYLNLDIFTLNHHGYDTWNEFTDYVTIQTLLITARKDTPVRQAEQNDYIRSKVKEWFAWGDGTKVLTFPYQMGAYECLQPKEWIYHKGVERPFTSNLYTFPGSFNVVNALLTDGVISAELEKWLADKGIRVAQIASGNGMEMTERLLGEMEELGQTRQTCYVLGDSRDMVDAAYAAGMRMAFIERKMSADVDISARSRNVIMKDTELIEIFEKEALRGKKRHG